MTDKGADWATIQAEFVGNRGSIRAIARRHRVSDTAIRKRARAEGWSRSREQSSQCEPAAAEPVRAAFAAGVSVSERIQDLAERMLDELAAETSHLAELEEIILRATAADEDPGRRNAMLRAIGLPTRAAVLKSLAATARAVSQPGRGGTAGKKAQAAEEAKTAGVGTNWGDDLGTTVN